MNAYKARDLEAFLATYSPDTKIFNHPDSLLYSGLEEIKSVYESLFEHAPNLHVQIVNRISLGKFVIDREKVTGEVKHAVAIYEIQDDLIQRVWFIRE